MSPLSASCLEETQTFPSAQETYSDLLSVLVSACSRSLCYLLLVSDKVRQSGTLFLSLLSPGTEFQFSFFLLDYLKGLSPVNHTGTRVKEATPPKLNSRVTNQNEITESEKDVELLTAGYKCCSSCP